MLKPIYKHVSRCVSDMRNETTAFIKRKSSFSEFCSASKQHVATAWKECTRPPATEAHKRALLHLNKGMASYKDNLFADAANEFEKAIDADPKYGRAHYYYANAQYKLRNFDEACKSWEFVVRIDPDSPAAEKARERLARFAQEHQRPQTARQPHLEHS